MREIVILTVFLGVILVILRLVIFFLQGVRYKEQQSMKVREKRVEQLPSEGFIATVIAAIASFEEVEISKGKIERGRKKKEGLSLWKWSQRANWR